MGMVQGAVYDAVNAIGPTRYRPYLLKTRTSDMAAYREFIGTVIWTLPGVRETRTYAVMEEVKHITTLAL